MSRKEPQKLIYDHITRIRFNTYEFTLVSAEELYNTTAEFHHQHPFYEIYYCLEGFLQIKVQDTVVKLNRQELLVIAKNVEHHVLFEPNRNFHYFVLIWDLFPVITHSYHGPEGVHEWEDLREVMAKLDTVQYIHSEIPFNGSEILDLIKTEWNKKQLGWNSAIVFKLYEFMVKALRQAIRTKITDQNLAGALNLGIAASKFLHAHFSEPVTLDDVAKHLNYSTRHVNRAYKQIFNTSVMKNLNLLRIEYAKRYLCFTDYSAEKISELIGLSCSRNLYKLFKKYTGISIPQYRDKKQKLPESKNSGSG